MEEIKIKYDGKWPCLCSGHLEVWIGEKYFDFGSHVLCSGGRICRNENWDMWAERGPWYLDIEDYPKDFPKDRQKDLVSIINEKIEWGCCGGCI